MFYFDTRYNLESGLWQFKIELNNTVRWSKPMSANDLETVVRHLQQYKNLPESANFNMKAIDAAALLATGVLSNVKVTKLQPTHPALTRAASMRQVSELRAMTAEQILAKLGPISAKN